MLYFLGSKSNNEVKPNSGMKSFLIPNVGMKSNSVVVVNGFVVVAVVVAVVVYVVVEQLKQQLVVFV